MQLQYNVNLQAYNTFGFNVTAQQFASVNSVQQATEYLQYAQQQHIPVSILGGGSNILLTKNVEGLLLHNQIMGMRVVTEDDTTCTVECGAGELWHNFVLWTIDQGLQGLENLSLIPGTCGAAPMQNIGAYGVEIKDYFHSLTALDRQSFTTESFDLARCAFGYRESIFKRGAKDRYIICSVQFKLNKVPKFNTSYGAITETLQRLFPAQPLSTKNISAAVISIRQSKLPNPAEIGNAGSFFKNPEISTEQFMDLQKKYPAIPSYATKPGYVKVPAGWLIEQCGFKGQVHGKVGVHKNQALVLVHFGGGSGADVYKLSTEIIDTVAEKYNITLEREVNVW